MNGQATVILNITVKILVTLLLKMESYVIQLILIMSAVQKNRQVHSKQASVSVSFLWHNTLV